MRVFEIHPDVAERSLPFADLGSFTGRIDFDGPITCGDLRPLHAAAGEE
jgi:hypothetical protein